MKEEGEGKEGKEEGGGVWKQKDSDGRQFRSTNTSTKDN